MTPGLKLLCASVPQPRRLWSLAAWSGIECAPGLLSGYTIARAMDAVVTRHMWAAGAWLLVLALAIGVGVLATRRLYGAIAPVVEDMRDELMSGAIRGTVAACAASGRPGRATVTQVVAQVDQVRNLVSALLRSLRSAIMPLGSAVIGLHLLDPLFGLAAAVPLLAAVLIQAALVPLTVRRQRSATLAAEEFGCAAAAILADLSALRGIGVNEHCGRRLIGHVDSVAERELAVVRTTSLRHGVILLGAHAPLLAVLLLAGPLLRNHAVTPGAVLGAATYVLTGLAPAVGAFASMSGGWVVELIVLIDRLAVVTGQSGPIPSSGSASSEIGSDPLDDPLDPIGSLALYGVCFAYRPNSRPIMTDLKLDVTPGEHVAVLGASGAGKSTLARLIAHLQEPTDGSIQTTGRVCYVPQESYVFAGTLRDNLTHLAEQHPVQDDELDGVAGTFGLRPLIHRVGGLGAEISRRDERVSAADRQRIVLARAWLSRADIVILDEATSLIGAKERLVVESLHRRQGRTLISIAHDLDVAPRADQIIYFDGAGAHVGCHESLLRCTPSYADLYTYADVLLESGQSHGEPAYGAQPAADPSSAGLRRLVGSTPSPARPSSRGSAPVGDAPRRCATALPAAHRPGSTDPSARRV